MRTVYIGTSAFAAAVLERLTASQHRPALAVSRPDRPRGRGRKLAPPPVAQAARSLGIDLFQPEDVNAPEALERIVAADPGAACVCAYGALIREPLLSAYPMLNVHPSLLPRWRGAAPIERAIMAGDDQTGVSIMRLVEGLDSGPVCLRQAEPIRADDDYGSLAARLERLGGELLVRALDEGRAFEDQDESGATYAEKVGPGDRLLDPARAAADLEHLVRALHPHIGARLELPGGELLGVRRARVAGGAVAEGELLFHDGGLLLGCSAGALELIEVQPAGGRPMPAADYARGRRLGG